MKTGLQLRTSQQLALTPQLQQSIRLLQLSTLELQQELTNMLIENPMLERVDNVLEQAVSLHPDGSLNTHTHQAQELPQSQNERTENEVSPNEVSPNNETFDDTLSDTSQTSLDNLDHDDFGNYTSKNSEDDEGRFQLEAHPISLKEHLQQQMRLLAINQRTQGLLEILIDAIDDNGYLSESIESIYESLPLELRITESELEAALSLLQEFEPTGVGARHIQECLHLQIMQLPRIPYMTRKHALIIAQEHLPLLGQRDFTKIKKLMRIDDEDLREAQQVILQCKAKPGLAFSHHKTDYIVPDIVVQRIGKKWEALLNKDVMPQLKINQLYAHLLRNQKNESQLNQQLQEARWLIKNMKQRFDTILRVSEVIVQRQQAFFNYGELAMRPLVLREIADKLELHESTISRVTTQKYMMTPHGIFELKYFFTSHIATDTGGEASSTAIRALIKQIIGEENPKKPLSDNKLAEILADQGMMIARRTVAKYRESLKIPAANLRKTI